MSRGELGFVALVALVALLLRMGSSAGVPFYEWDSGFFFARIVEDLGQIAAGHADSQYGAAHPVYNMMGFSVAVRVVRDALGLSTASAGQLVVFLAATLLVPATWALARRIGGPRAGCLAAVLVALDAREIEFSVQAFNILPCAVLVAASVILVQGRRRLAVAGILVGLTTGIRSDALAAGAVLALHVLLSAREGVLARRSSFLFVAAWIATAGAVLAIQWALMRRNGAADYLTHVHADALYISGHYPDAYFVDATGATLRIAAAPPSLGAWTFELVLRQLATSLGACAREIGVLVLLAALGMALLERGASAAGWLVAVALSVPVFTVLALAPATDMWRYTGASRPFLLAVISTGAVAALDRLRRTRAGARLLAGPMLPGVAVVLALLVVWPPASALGLINYSRGERARAAACASSLSTLLPPRARVARGPGGDPVIVSLAGARLVHLAAGPTPSAIAAYLRANDLRWIVYDARESATVALMLPGLRLERLATYEVNGSQQVLALVR